MPRHIQIRDNKGGNDVEMRRAGAAYACTLPATMVEAAGFRDGRIGKAGRRKRNRFTLDALLSELPETVELTDEQRGWEHMRPTGKEV
ncbi:hypothetical protein [Asticcacaulis sp. W401b]|uniref:hypothetical protein n=1 Tax=Asticcacaulis sp. W401b TaxID=3388666 RepID=UPI003970E996